MDRLLYFIYTYRAFFTFLGLEVLCAWMIVNHNNYQGAGYFNSSNTVIATLNNFSQGIRDYFLLREVNASLSQENAELRRQLEHYNQRLHVLDTLSKSDSALVTRFDFISAKVVNNQVDRFKNFITIDRGKDSGLEPGMAVISPKGVVGKVKVVSNHYSVVTSLLNIDGMVSATLKRTGHFGSVQWDGSNPMQVDYKFIPRHVKPMIGDTIVTSGFNAIYPEGVLIGTIEEIELKDEALFYDLKLKVSQDFRKLSFVTVVRSELKEEQDSLQHIINILER
jgi:rod shape-determining protein MreC